MPTFRDDVSKSKELLQAATQALDAALVVMNRLSRFKTHTDAEQITLMKQRLAHVRRYRQDFDLAFARVEEGAAALEKSRK